MRLRRGRGVEAGKSLRHFLDHALVVDRAGGGHHHVGAAVMRREIAAQHVAIEILQRLRGAQQRTAHRLVRKAEFVEVLEHDVIGRILRRADFLHDDALLALEFVRHEGRIGQDVGEHVERERHVGLHHPRIIGGGFGRGAGVEIAADRLDFLDDLARGAPGRALEGHVFQKMRDAVLVRLLVTAADAGPDAERRGFQMRHGVGDDGQAGRQLGYVNAHPATPCFAARLTERTNCSTSAESFFITVMCSDLVIRPSSQAGSCGRTPQAASTASGNLAGCAVDSTMLGIPEIRGVAVGHRQRHRGMGIDEVAGLAPGGADRGRRLGLVGAAGVELLADRSQHGIRQHETSGLFQRAHQPANAVGVAAARLEQQPLEIRGDLDVHRGRSGGVNFAHLVDAGLERARQDVVDVGGDAQPADRQAHLLGDIARKDIAEIAGRHGEIHRARGRAERDGRGEIIHHLRHDPRPVDRVDARQRDRIAKAVMVEHRLHDRLAIVERAFDRERMHVGRARRRHHPPLHVGDAPVREQHDQIDIVETRERIDRGAAGIARGRDHDGGALVALGQHVIHQPRDQLHRDVLERQRRAVEQLQHELIGPDLVERHHRRMAEGRVGFVRHAAEIGVGDFARGERPDHVDRDFPIGPAEKSGDGLGRELRPDLGHVEAAVAGKPGQHHIAETQDGGLPPRRNIARQTTLQRRRPYAKPLILIMYFISPNAKRGGTIKRFGAKGKWQGVKKWGWRDGHPARSEPGYFPVIASAAKQSIRGKRRGGLLRCARNDVDMTSRSRGALRPRFAGYLVCPLSNQRGAGKTGCTLHPRSRVQFAHENAHTSIQVQRKHSGLPCAMGFTGLLRALPVDGSFATVGQKLGFPPI